MSKADPASPGQIPKPAALPRPSRPAAPPSSAHPHCAQFVLGSEFAGRIAAGSPIPAGCPFKAGDRVFGSGQGAFGARVAARWPLLLRIPDVLDYDQAAGTAALLRVVRSLMKIACRAVHHVADEL
jgi:NADPH:quinone reductase-like Zn-dependent oxidoreductase